MLARCISRFTLVAAGFAAVNCGGRNASTTTDGAGGGSGTTGAMASTTSGDAVGAGPTGASATSGTPAGSTATTGGETVGTGGASGSSGACSGGLDGASLAGGWHAIGTRIGGRALELGITIDSQQLAIQTAHGSFVAQKFGAAFTVTYVDDSGSGPKRLAATQQIGGSLALGAFPIDLSGSWTFRNIPGPNETVPDMLGCDATLSANNVSTICSATRLPTWVRPYDPGPGSAMGTKVAEGSSAFGDLSGTWSVPLRTATCTFRFEGSTFASDCGPKLGGMKMTFCASMASGTTSSGIEFSAQRL